jgi:prefoldin subunit 4
VRREDQEKINKFSSLHQKEEILEEELRAKIVCCETLPLVGM